MKREKSIAFLGMVRQLERMFKIDELLGAHPNHLFTLEQMSHHLDCSTRTIERIYKVMKRFGAPLYTTTKSKERATGGTCYKLSRNATYKLDINYALMTRIMSTHRMHQEQCKAMRDKKNLNRVQSLLTKI